MSLLTQQQVNIKARDNSLQMSKSSRKFCNQEYFTLTFPEPPQPGRAKRLRLSGLETTAPRYDKRKLEEVHKPAQIWIRHFSRKKFQRLSNYFTVIRQAPFSHPCTPKGHPEKPESKMPEDSKRNIGPHENVPESKKRANDKKPKRGDKTDKTPSKSSHESELSKKSQYKSKTNPELKDSKAILINDPRKGKRDFKNFKEINIESICTQKHSKSSENNCDAKSEASSKDNSNTDLMISLEESATESMEFDMWLKNCSQNNSKKPSSNEANETSDTDSLDSKEGKKGNKGAKKDNKKDAKKDTESSDESVDSNDAKKGSKKAKKDLKKIDKKKESKKETESTDSGSESESDSKKVRRDSKKKISKKDAKKYTVSTDDDSESERISKKGEKDEKMDNGGSKKDNKKKSAIKSEESSETESDWDSRKAKRNSKKNAKKHSEKNIESTDVETDESFEKDPKKTGLIKSSDTDSDDSIHKYGAKKKAVEESDSTSTDSKKGVLKPKRDVKTRFAKTAFKGKQKAVTGRVPSSSESSPLSQSPHDPDPVVLSPKTKRLYQCKLLPSPPKPRYAPLPEKKWIHKLL